ncbi:MAG TPA: 3-deoxy-manno-octulosonate cytidylyltransferase [Pyrinomonadaceae bacterium]|nr:3-deoxy-manno-octulosonate cytidylyltransferase [Pyrinomonadaceae bacterium]
MNHTDSPAPSKAVAIIPARYNSTRLPGKPLLPIDGQALILHVAERAARARNVSRVIVATDDRRILDAVNDAGFEAVMTAAHHASGSDRLAEVAAALDAAEAGLIVNVQGDEPLISPETIERAVRALQDDAAAVVSTTSEAIESAADVLSADVVKVLTDETGRALYFSRSPVPYPREAVREHGTLADALNADPSLLSLFRKHTGLYVYRRAFLLEYAKWPQTFLERTESLEQLRMLERGATIRVVGAAAPSVGVDTPEDLERVRALFESRKQSKV